MSDNFGPGGNKTVLSSLKAGNTTNGNFTEVEKDGTVVTHGEGTVWDEVAQSFVGKNLLSSVGRVDYNFTELTVDFSTTARYPEEPVGMVTQLLHARKNDSDIRPHIHWIQSSNNIPNILIEYRWYNNGEQVPAVWSQKALLISDNLFVYDDSGAMQQITEIGLPVGSGIGNGLSSTFEVKIYRDTANTSGLFIGTDTYVGNFQAKYFDIHLEKDMNGSRQEYVK